MSDTMDRIKKTIRDLLNLADNDAAFDQEAENALRFARKLMMRHGLDQSDMEQERDVHQVAAAAEVEYGTKHCFSESSTLSAWETQLASTILKMIGTVQYYVETKMLKRSEHGTIQFNRQGRQVTGTRMTFYGPAGDCEDAIALLDEWRQIVMAMARLKYGGVFKGEGRSYCEGFATALWNKMSTISQEEQQAAKQLDGAERSTALMVINSTAIALAKKERGSDWLTKEKGVTLKARPSTSYRKHHHGAYGDGKTDGEKSNLSHSRKKRLEG